jgi:hypothetical protein
VESSCEFGIEHSGSIKCWETIECPNNWGSLGSTELVRSQNSKLAPAVLENLQPNESCNITSISHSK